MKKEVEIIVPVSCQDGLTVKQISESIIEQYTKFEIKTFVLALPNIGCRSTGYPKKEEYEQSARFFNEVKDKLKGKDIQLGWWVAVTLKSGRSESFSPIIKANGQAHPFANCPLDDNFRTRFAKNVALFSQIAKPAFILFEDDYNIFAAAGGYGGCFCEKHLEEFARLMGKRYEREELLDIFNKRDEESIDILRKHRELSKRTMVELSQIIREELDKESPEIPMGLCQSGGVDRDGDTTEGICSALAGKNHTPFARLHGAFYCGGEHKAIPCVVYHAIYSKQHINRDFKFIYEADTFPHTRFFTSEKQMKTFMNIAYSYGFSGSVFQTQQILDDPNEEKVFGNMFFEEKERFSEIMDITSDCKNLGVEIPYNPFYNTIDNHQSPTPFWVRTVSLFGIPYVTTPACVAFIDERQAKYCTDKELKRYLSGGLFIDGATAKILCERGYAKYIGVSVGDDVATKDNVLYDLGARETITPPFDTFSKGKNMPIAHMFCPKGNGRLLKLTKIDERCEIISEAYTYDKQLLSVAMTRFKNELGGRVVVMGMTIEKNFSQSLFNYRRKRLFEELLIWCADEVPFVRNEPNVYFICNESKAKTDFNYQFTLINLGYDTINEISIHLPKKMEFEELYSLKKNGEWEKIEFVSNEDGFIIKQPFEHCEPVNLLLK